MTETEQKSGKFPFLYGAVRDVRVAVNFLTRLPAGWIDGLKSTDLAAAAWAFPIVGALVGALGGGVVYLAAVPSLHPMACALLGIGFQVWITGALHEDGLADVADGFGAMDRVRRLEIMRDSRIGTYGVLALIFSVGLRVALLASVAGPARAWLAMIAAAMISRAVMVPVMAWIDSARPDGLSKDAGRPSKSAVLVACGLSVGGAFLLLPLAPALIAIAAAAALTVAVALWARRVLGGQTGDILGALQQIVEIAVLIGAAGYAGGYY